MLSDSAIAEIFARFETADPHPKTELEAPNPFCLLVSIVLSAQSTDVAVNKATKGLYAVADSPAAILALGEENLRGYIRSIGLYPTKAKNIMSLCRTLLEHHHGQVPEDAQVLQTLAGVGRKTAHVWLNCVKGAPLIAVDTHVFRVANRLGITDATNVVQSEAQLMQRVPERYRVHAHHWLILHGRYTCKARNPACSNCRLADVCLHLCHSITKNP
jgi:endonuclease III